MKNPITRNFLLSLAWINSGENSPNYYEVVFRLKNPDTKHECSYIAFPFSSLDLMYIYLKNLAKKFKVSSIDNLASVDFPVNISYFEGFESPPTFEYLYISEENIWPNKNIRGHFLLDYPY